MAHAHGPAAEERVANDPRSELWGEHRSRYRFASHWVTGKRVLDIACGVGFGAVLLAAAGGRVLGLDRDAAALYEARVAGAATCLALADGTRLPLRDDDLDVIVCFETIEHIAGYASFVGELRRVLRPDGVLILSTPNRAFGPASLHQNNPYHVREFTGDELEELLRTEFGHVQLYGQWVSSPYRYVPFLLVNPHRAPRALAWRLMNRLPFTVKEALARTAGGRPFYPSQEDYLFLPGVWQGAHALVAVARAPRTA